MTLRSMTGFARVRETIGDIEIVLSLKSVNHRGLDLHFYASAELDPFEAAMRSAVKQQVGRGHIDVRIQLAQTGSNGSFGVDTARLDAWIAAFHAASGKYGLSAPPDLNTAFRAPGILSDTTVPELPEGFERPLLRILGTALEQLNSFREREGREIGSLLAERAGNLARIADEVENCRKTAFPAYQARLRERLSDLLAGSGVDAQRVVQEAAILADRSDIGEEIERLRIHSGQVRDLLSTGEEVGKKLDFLLQEMNRETNTILSKTTGLGEHGLRITELAVAAKSEIEKMREQSLNLE